MKKIFILLTLLTQPIQPMENVKNFLETIASAEPAEWQMSVATLEKQLPGTTICQKLNELSAHILQQNDQNLIHLLQRAVLNFDALSEQKTEPFTFYYKNYQPPAFFIPEIELTLDVQKEKVNVRSHLYVKKNSTSKSLVLDGRNHIVHSVYVNDKLAPKENYRVTMNELILEKIPADEQFTVTVLSEIDPYHNHSMEGLYLSGEFLTSQCESEGARKIFFTLDRPDVLSRITTTIIADPKKYPYRLSNGNFVSESTLNDGRSKIVWNDPTLKPSYLYACVLGNFGKIEDHFITKSGRNVLLEVYVEPGKEARAIYSMEALKLSMKFDEVFFDREYDLDHMKMVGVPDFNAGAMENKGLMVFNDTSLLVDQHSGTDSSFRSVATTVAHEYFHNWSGNRVTVRNWFELALKEAFTDFRAMLFGEWLFGAEFIRPKDVTRLKEAQFPEETSEGGHPIMVESYVNAHSIYDATTYVKGREVFRCLQTYLDMMEPEGFRKAQNIYFSRYDGQAVTFRELLSAANDVLQNKESLTQFERWFNQQGTPQVHIEIDPKKNLLKVTQSCPNPKTGAPQKPFLIPFSYEFLHKDGTVAAPKINTILTQGTHEFEITKAADVIPVVMHGYSAPVILHYNYSLDELACLMTYESDPYCRWEAGQNYSLMAFKEVLSRFQREGENCNVEDILKPYTVALQSKQLSLLAKAQLLQTPSLRALSQKFNDYDFPKLKRARDFFLQKLGVICTPVLQELLREHPEPSKFEPTSEQMQTRELRKACLHLLAEGDSKEAGKLLTTYKGAKDFDTSFSSFVILANLDTPLKQGVISDFYSKWKGDKAVFNYWLSALAGSRSCTPVELKELMNVQGYDPKNPNHIRAVVRTFISNLGQYHDAKGEGYAFVIDQILQIGKYNSNLAHALATAALIDYDKLPQTQQKLMEREVRRLQNSAAPAEIRDLARKLVRGS